VVTWSRTDTICWSFRCESGSDASNPAVDRLSRFDQSHLQAVDELFSSKDAGDDHPPGPVLHATLIEKGAKGGLDRILAVFGKLDEEGFDPDRTMERAKELQTLRSVMLDKKLHTLAAQI